MKSKKLINIIFLLLGLFILFIGLIFKSILLVCVSYLLLPITFVYNYKYFKNRKYEYTDKFKQIIILILFIISLFGSIMCLFFEGYSLIIFASIHFIFAFLLYGILLYNLIFRIYFVFKYEQNFMFNRKNIIVFVMEIIMCLILFISISL